MANVKMFKEVIAEFKSDTKKHSMAELVARVWKDKVIELYIGDTYEDLRFDESTQKVPAMVIGKVIDAYGECLVLDCAYVDQVSGKIQFGNIVCLNERSVRTITEVDNSGVLRDTFLNSKDAKVVKALNEGLRGK